jgi:hypothetical protein
VELIRQFSQLVCGYSWHIVSKPQQVSVNSWTLDFIIFAYRSIAFLFAAVAAETHDRMQGPTHFLEPHLGKSRGCAVTCRRPCGALWSAVEPYGALYISVCEKPLHKAVRPSALSRDIESFH